MSFFAPKPPIIEDKKEELSAQSVSTPITAPNLPTFPSIQTPVQEPDFSPIDRDIQSPSTKDLEPPISESDFSSAMVSSPLENVQMDEYTSPMTEDAPAVERVVVESISTLPKIDDVWFSDLYFTPEKVAYIHNKRSQFGLEVFDAEDLMDFHKALEEGFQGNSSYSIRYGNSLYRIERVKTVSGIHYTARRMPREIPDIYKLGIPLPLVQHLTSLNPCSGLILLCGPTGMGKTTTATALLKYYLENEGGFAYTIEDPPEMPLDGVYKARGGLGVCKQTEVVNNNWDLGLRSALRSKPRYILVGEIRTAETASEMLRAATSGHLVISTVHANNLEDGLNSVVKYAIAGGMNEGLASDLLARGILAIIHQKLTGTVKLTPNLQYCFANPDLMEADQMRMIIREGKINLGTLIEAQTAKIIQGKPLFKKI